MSYLRMRLSAREEARLFIERIEATEGIQGSAFEKYTAIEAAVDECAPSFFEAVRIAMVDVGDVSSSDFRCLEEVRQYYPLSLPTDPREQVITVDEISERGRQLLSAVRKSLEHQLARTQTPQEVLSALMLLVRSCEDVNFERIFG